MKTAKELNQVRIQQGISCKQIAKVVGVSQTTISAVLLGTYTGDAAYFLAFIEGYLFG